jgi:outer membrane protein TolC
MNKISFHRSILILTALLFFNPGINFAQPGKQNALTLDKAIQLTINNYPLIKQEQEKINAVDYKIEQQKSYYYPNIEGEASYSRIGPLPSFNFGEEELILAPANNYNLNVILNEEIYDFGKRGASVDLVNSYKQSASDNVDLVKSNLSYQTLMTFYSILFIEKSIAVKDTQIASLNAHLGETDKKIESGSATDYDALSTQVRISQAQSEKIELLNQQKQQQINLKQLLGVAQDTTLTIIGDFSAPSPISNIDSLINISFQKRSELKLAEDELNTSHLQEHVAGLGNAPSLNATLGYGIKNGYEPNLDALRGNWVAALSLKVPIFNGFLTKNQEGEAKVNSNVLVLNITTLKRNIISDVQEAASNLNSNLDKLNSTLTQVKFAEQTVQRAISRYDSGVGTNLDLLDAETSLAEARFFYLRDLYKSILSSYQLKKAVGDVIYQ